MDVLRPLLTEARLAKLQNVIARRTRTSVVLENVYQSRNASAVMRSADGLGLLDVHLIENENAWSRNKGVAKGFPMAQPAPLSPRRRSTFGVRRSHQISRHPTGRDLPPCEGFTPETFPPTALWPW